MALNDLFTDNQDPVLQKPGSSSVSSCSLPSATEKPHGIIHDIGPIITARSELRIRNAEPQNGGDPCSQASQSASQAIQQASQQASESIRQASQQASQSIQQASQQASQASREAFQSASQSIQQAQNSASQQIAAASRSISSAMSSANSISSSISASAARAISQANSRMSAAQASAASAQAEASSAVIQAGAAVAAATGSAAAAGSSFLAAAAKATEGAQASISAFGQAAASQIADASQQVKASQVQAVTATQAAVAIVGSIIASSLLSILIFYLISRRQKKKKKARKAQLLRSPDTSSRDLVSPQADYQPEPKPSFSAEGESTLVPSQSNPPTRDTILESSTAQNSFSLFPKPPSGKNGQSNQRDSEIKTTSVSWNPANPPKVPALSSWLKLQSETVSPFGPIQLPTDVDSNAPLGGQLKSPLTTMARPESSSSTRKAVNIASPKRTRTTPPLTEASNNLNSSPSKSNLKGPFQSQSAKSPSPDTLLRNYRAYKASVWTDDDTPSPPPRTSSIRAPLSPSSATTLTRFPSPKQPVRNTAEWLSERRPPSSRGSISAGGGSVPDGVRGFGLPSNPGAGLMSKQRGRKSEIRIVNDNDKEEEGKGKGKQKMRNTEEDGGNRTPGVGKAL
ncbi:hypothetical protein F5884DRAFT_755102 [Xylogone sp. PMI_703]|nr:hypothetical protein F5884DRAFT_755102 [Xylogone sp. PMI_703]